MSNKPRTFPRLRGVWQGTGGERVTSGPILSERQWACMGFTMVANIANCLATADAPEWREYWSGVVTAITLASYLYQALSILAAIYERKVNERLSGYTKHVIEVDG